MLGNSSSPNAFFWSRRNVRATPVTVMWLALWIITMSTKSTKAIEHPQCCTNGTEILLAANICADQTPVNLPCSRLFYTQKKFEIAENGSLIVYRFTPNGIVPKIEERFCLTSSNGAAVACICFALQEPKQSDIRIKILRVGSIVSLTFCIITLSVYIYLPKLRDLQDRSIMSLVVSFGGSCLGCYLLWTFKSIHYSKVQCTALAFFVPYTMLVTILWMSLIAFRVWQSVWFPGVRKTKYTFLIYSLIAWGVPAAITITGLTSSWSYKAPSDCIYKDKETILKYCHGPIFILSCLNILLFAMTFYRLSKIDEKTSKWRILENKSILIFKLGIIMGITWIFETISLLVDLKVFGIVMDTVNILYGLWIFLITVVTRKKVKQQLAGKDLFCISFPNSWLDRQDEEHSHSADEEIEQQVQYSRDPNQPSTSLIEHS